MLKELNPSLNTKVSIFPNEDEIARLIKLSELDPIANTEFPAILDVKLFFNSPGDVKDAVKLFVVASTNDNLKYILSFLTRRRESPLLTNRFNVPFKFCLISLGDDNEVI